MNEKIQHARDVALGLLKPSQKQIEHGLALHADSVVVESYGFAPRTSPDADAINAAYEAGASEIELRQLSGEGRLTRVASEPEERKEFLEAFEASGVTCILQNAGEESNVIDRLIRRMGYFTHVTDVLRERVFKAVSADDIVRAKAEGRHCLVLTCNGVPLTGRWDSAADELRYVRIFQMLGCRMMHLTYNRRNAIGDGCAEPANGGLSEFGREAVDELNRAGVIADVAHSSWQTSLDAAEASEQPIVASHTVCSGLSDHIRGKPDEVIEAIAGKGGNIGVCCVPAFLQGTGDIRAMLDHIDYLARLVGADHITIGTDVAYESRLANDHWRRLPKYRRSRAAFESFWPEGDPLHDAKWKKPEMRDSMAWTNWPIFTVGLVQRGYSDDDIRKIIGGNVLRVGRAVWEASA